jgi:GT2 family glycosyltransferase
MAANIRAWFWPGPRLISLMFKHSPPQLQPQHLKAQSEKVSIIVLNWNSLTFLKRALDSIVTMTDEPYELIIIDNGSVDGSKGFIRSFVKDHSSLDVEPIFNRRNLFFSKAYNQGFQASSKNVQYAMVFCNDVEVKEKGWLRNFTQTIQREGTIATGQARRVPVEDYQRKLYFRNNPTYLQPGLKDKMDAFFRNPQASYDHIYGFCFLLNKHYLAETGLYLERGDFKQYHSDWEWYIRFQVMGYQIASIKPKVHHWHSISELIAFYPHLYKDLLKKLDQPALVQQYLAHGRPLYEAESGYQSLQKERQGKG